MKTINRRESPRVDIRLRCHVTSPPLWPGDAIYTENISRTGLMISWAQTGLGSSLPRIGQIITVEIELPAHHGFGRKCIHVQGSVVRLLDPDLDVTRIALSVNYMDFRSFADSLAALRPAEPEMRGWMA
jgi:hypothetical protein